MFGARIEIRELNLIKSEPEFPEEFVTYEEVLPLVQEEVPIDGREVVEWMQECEAANRVLDVFAMSYGRSGGVFSYATGDPYIPGLSYEGYRFRKEQGHIVARRGYAIVDPGAHRVQRNSWSWVDMLRVLAAVGRTWYLQFNGLIAVFKRYAKIPTRSRIGFPRVWGMTLPIVLQQSFIIPPPVATYRIVMSSDRDSRVSINFYSTGRSLYASRDVDLRRGQQEVVIVLFMPQSGYIEFRPLSNAKMTIDRVDRIPPV